MGNRIYGCDDCLSACPWNKFAQEASEIKLVAREDLKAPELAEFLAMDDPSFRKHFSGSPVKRIGWARFIRNCLVAAGNSACDNLIQPVLEKIKEDDPIIRQHAVWALGQLLSKAQFAHYRDMHEPDELDSKVLEEWHSTR
jgi:epoxyqueuosine reductase